jgi:orotate phosphoribosyltransferase
MAQTPAETIAGAAAGAIPIVGEVAKVLLGFYFEYMKQKGKTEAESEALYQEAKAEFLARDPSQIPDV